MNRLGQPNLEPAPAFELRGHASPVAHLRKTHPDQPLVRHVGELDSQPGALRRLRAVVLLAGAVGASGFRAAVGRALVDLPIETGRTILSQWWDECASVAESSSIKPLPVRILVDGSAQSPTVPQTDTWLQFTVERDPSEFRGTGGLLRDIARNYAEEDYLLVANGAQILQTPLAQLAHDLAIQTAPVVVVSHADGTPSGAMLVRCDCLREIPSIGFVDMKEQGLGMIARRHTVKVLQQAVPTAFPVRTFVNYLAALRQVHRPVGGSKIEDWESSFGIVESGAEVASDATVHDSVVLSGSRVEKGAVVINSVVCPGAVVARGRTVTDELVKPTGRR